MNFVETTSPLRSDQMIIQITNNDALSKDGRLCPRVKFAGTLSISVFTTDMWQK